MAWKKLPKNFGNDNRTAALDDIDRSSEAEGAAMKEFNDNYATESRGKRLLKMRAKESRGAAIVGVKRVNKFTKDHNEAVEKYTG